MDIEEWELLPDDGFLEIHDDGGKKIFSRKYGCDPKNDFDMNYFICPSPKSHQKSRDPPPERVVVPNQLVPVSIPLHQSSVKALDDELMKQVATNKFPTEEELSLVPSVITDKVKIIPNIQGFEANQDTVSQVFFKKENEFVDMKMDSPRSSSRGIVPAGGTFQFEGKSEAATEGGGKMKVEKDNNFVLDSSPTDMKRQEQTGWQEEEGGFNMWRWSLTGIGAICSFGVAAATVCIIIFGTHHKSKHQHNQKLRFQIYADDKRIKQVVQHTTKLNEAISAVRGVPLTRAHFTVGGYYDGL